MPRFVPTVTSSAGLVHVDYWARLRVGLIGLLLPATLAAAPVVQVLRTPANGLQPQAAVDSKGTLHLVYLGGDPAAADVFHVSRAPDSNTFSQPRRVNHQPGSAIAVGTIRGAQISIGRGDRPHVVWNGSAKAGPRPFRGQPLLYSRLDHAGTGFEPERNLMQSTADLDGGGTIAAGRDGRVYVLWHAAATNGTPGEANRAVYLATSTNDGTSFTSERRIAPVGSGGICACCGMRAVVDSRQNLLALYRAADRSVERPTMLLRVSTDGGGIETRPLNLWRTASCPMSSASLSALPDGGVLAAWETSKSVEFTRLDGTNPGTFPTWSPAGDVRGKHPVAVANRAGEMLLVWTEGTGWKRGGRLAWQTFDASGKPLGTVEHREGLPVWGLATAFAELDGSFTVVY